MELQKKKHSVGGIILVVLSLLAGLLLTMLLGAVGGGLAAVLALIALLLGLNCKRKGGKGLGVVLMSLVSILIAVVLTFSSVAAIKGFHDTAREYGDLPLVEKYSENPYLGLFGISYRAAKDGVDAEALTRELQLLNQRVDNPNGTEAPNGTETAAK